MAIRVLTMLLVAGFGSLSATAVETMTLDTEKSKIEFVGAKSDGKHDGGFKKFAAKATAGHDDSAKNELMIEIDTPSLWSDNSKLTNHLKNPDFFNVRKYPNITFKSTKVAMGDEGKGTITGVMKMLDKEVEVKIPVEATMTDSQLTLVADFKIDRTKWGMTYGEGKVNNDVAIKAVLVFNR